MAVEWKVIVDSREALEIEANRVYEIDEMKRINLIAKCPDENCAKRIVDAFNAAKEAGVRI